jgi:hypothetical protein
LIIEPVPDLMTAIKLPKFGKTTVDEFQRSMSLKRSDRNLPWK